jgi:hypothetical protein
MVPVSPEYAEKLDRMMRGDLDFWSTYWFWFLIKSTVAVVFGLMAELPEVWSEVFRPIWTWCRNVWRAKVRKKDFSGWEIVYPELTAVTQIELSHPQRAVIGALALLGWMLVAVGVAGEGIGEYFVNDAETNVRSFDDAVLAETQQAAGAAATSAKIADEEADAATRASKEAQAKADRAGASAMLAESDARNAQQYATDLRAELLSFKLEASAIMSGHVFRRGNFKFAMGLGHPRVDITAVDGARFETVSFAESLGEMFEISKWHVAHTRMSEGRGVVIHNKWVSFSAISGPHAPRGASYEIDPDMPATDLVAVSGGKLSWGEALKLSALSAALGAKLQKDPEEDFPDDSIRIIIGDP